MINRQRSPVPRTLHVNNAFQCTTIVERRYYYYQYPPRCMRLNENNRQQRVTIVTA